MFWSFWIDSNTWQMIVNFTTFKDNLHHIGQLYSIFCVFDKECDKVPLNKLRQLLTVGSADSALINYDIELNGQLFEVRDHLHHRPLPIEFLYRAKAFASLLIARSQAYSRHEHMNILTYNYMNMQLQFFFFFKDNYCKVWSLLENTTMAETRTNNVKKESERERERERERSFWRECLREIYFTSLTNTIITNSLYSCGGPFLSYWVRLPPTVLGLSVLDKRVGSGPIVTHLGPACAQIMSCLPKLWSHAHGRQSCCRRVMASRHNNNNRKHVCH